jgi:D-threo-aldose 1-dehydrogenase
VSELASVGPLRTSRLGFGCSSMMRLSRRERLMVLAEALDRGVQHFDVARMYGLGQAEAELGQFARRRREQLTIATKFGIDPPQRLGWLARHQAPARAVIERAPRLRQLVKKRSSGAAPARSYTAAQARASLHESLRQLGTDYVDVLFVHDPSPRDDVRTEELLAFLSEQEQAGTIRAFGVSQDAYPELDVIDRLGPTAILQIRDDILIRSRRSRPAITFGVIGLAHAAVLGAFGQDPTMRSRWSRALDADLTRPEALAELLLAEALDANRTGIVLYNSLKRDRIAQAAALLDTPPPAERLVALRALVESDRALLCSATT